MRAQTAVPAAVPDRARGALGGLAIVGVVAAVVFVAIAADVFAGTRLSLVDAAIATWLHAHATPELTRALLVWTDLHSTIAVGVYATVATLLLAARRRWRDAAFVAIAVGGVLAVNALAKLAFHRARPVFDDPLLTLATYSFPSGHVAGSTVFYGLVVAFVFARTPDRRRRVCAVAAAALAVALVAFSRMALGVHFLSDAIAASAEGIAWLAACVGVFASLARTTTSEVRT